MKFGKFVVKFHIPILIAALVFLIPSVIGMQATRINYDMLNYLPDGMDTVTGQDLLLEDFGKGAFSFIIVENMQGKDVISLKEKIAAVPHVETVLWYDSFSDLSIPMHMLPQKIMTPSMPGTAPCWPSFSIHPPHRTTPWMPSGKSAPSPANTALSPACPLSLRT